MAVFRVRRSGPRVSAVDAYEFPSGVRQRFALQHGELSGDALRSVEAAARQWFRLAARHPKARLAMPSVIVDEFCREFLLHTREYADFCAAAFGRPALSAGSRPGELAATFRYAQEDEPREAGLLPALFRVDREVAVAGGRHYLADCGGRGTCYELKGTVCLQHLGGVGRALTGGRWNVQRGDHGGLADGYERGGGGSGCSGGGV
ncbi:hypothetical protein [Actinoplanes auranticolor]|uniref:Uncharacterized protein n=1 Tax=Actinoplanes auranticolor TaxID=47988 RepID=A0A919SN85_9ACTN|nr:hypothetical protein [Actinoplanes auranticolor]GIM74048.1 hypothetical protein Aau02nite_59010 [Actinoplanes auranticolor]